MRPAPRWGWMLAGGVLSVLFAVMLWRQLPASSLWLVGTLVGFSLITNGFTTTGVASAASSSSQTTEPTPAQPIR
jgi:uncharacterized membrane protein HdeD (DUF308 family)